MPILQIDFTAGFDNTKAIIKINNEQVANLELTTDYSTGLSHSQEFYLDAESTLLEIIMPDLNQNKYLNLELVRDTYVSVDLALDGQIQTTISNEIQTYF